MSSITTWVEMVIIIYQFLRSNDNMESTQMYFFFSLAQDLLQYYETIFSIFMNLQNDKVKILIVCITK